MSVLLFACLLSLAIAFRRSKQNQIEEAEGGVLSQPPPWWIHESKHEKAGWWWASPKLSPADSRAALGRAQDVHSSPVSTDCTHPQFPALVLDGNLLKSSPARPRIAATRAQFRIGAPRSPAGRRRNLVRHPVLPSRTPVDVLFAIDSKSRSSPPHRRPAPLKIRDHRLRKANKVQSIITSPLPCQLETVV
jgi:hypothetical protein